jgi:acetyl-CoA synthetase
MDAYHALYDEAKADPAAFWAKLAREELTWFKDFETPLEWNPPFAKWFVGGKINASFNCLDRHLNGPRRKSRAISAPSPTRNCTGWSAASPLFSRTED